MEGGLGRPHSVILCQPLHAMVAVYVSAPGNTRSIKAVRFNGLPGKLRGGIRVALCAGTQRKVSFDDVVKSCHALTSFGKEGATP
jgi:hypothetical protein